jgi:hypothetical protein
MPDGTLKVLTSWDLGPDVGTLSSISMFPLFFILCCLLLRCYIALYSHAAGEGQRQRGAEVMQKGRDSETDC